MLNSQIILSGDLWELKGTRIVKHCAYTLKALTIMAVVKASVNGMSLPLVGGLVIGVDTCKMQMVMDMRI